MWSRAVGVDAAMPVSYRISLPGPRRRRHLIDSAFASLCTVERGLLHTLRLGRQRPVANTDSHISRGHARVGLPPSVEGERHVSVMPMASTTQVTILRNSPGLGLRRQRQSASPQFRTGGQAAMTHTGVDTLQSPSIAAPNPRGVSMILWAAGMFPRGPTTACTRRVRCRTSPSREQRWRPTPILSMRWPRSNRPPRRRTANSDCSTANVPRPSRRACVEIRGGALHDQFVVDVIQGGAGTSTNMNVNEVIANRALEILGDAPRRLRPAASTGTRQSQPEHE